MRGLLLRRSDWALEKGAVLAEYDGDASQPVFKLSGAVREAAYERSPFARTALGVRADVVASSAADLRRYYDTYYRPNNATLIVTGDVKSRRRLSHGTPLFWFDPEQTAPIRRPLSPPGAIRHALVRMVSDYPYTLVDCAYRIPGDLDADARCHPSVREPHRQYAVDRLSQSRSFAASRSIIARTPIRRCTRASFMSYSPFAPASRSRAFATSLTRRSRAWRQPASIRSCSPRRKRRTRAKLFTPATRSPVWATASATRSVSSNTIRPTTIARSTP